ncbi:NXPE family member 4-like [Asterias rubens]|uniref:NXPE family member 4-like n=1 Tax=Asterias rubens TaxID=7604 RepID=UPI00145515D8|nr:NXPE family member 4-like [Asterias rubens]
MNHNMYGCHVFRVVVGLCVAFICWTIMLLNSREQGNIAPPAIHDATTRLKQLHSDAGNSTDENLILKTWDGNDSSHTTRQKLERATGPSPMSITSHTKTNVQLISPRGHIQVGDIIKYRIQTRDSEGRDRVIGGDFWYATLNSANPQASTAGYVADYNNGTYEVTFLAAWAGQAEFKLILVHPSEAVNHLRNVVWPAEERVIWNGYFKHKNKKEETTTCFLRSSRPWTGLCQYPSHNALGKTILVCQKPKELSCDDFTSYNTNWDKCNQTVNKLTQGVQYLFKSPNFMQPVRIQKNETIQIDTGFLPALDDLPRCLPDQEIPAVQGYWLNGKWHSMLCRLPDFPKDMLRKCLRGKTVLLHGDSTTGQWYKEFYKALQVGRPVEQISNKKGELKPVQSFFRSMDLTLAYYFHPDRVGDPIWGRKDMKYEVDVLDKLTTLDCRRYIIVLSPWAHFTLWTRESFIERMALVRNAVLRLRKRCPKIVIVIKGPHPRHFIFYSQILEFSDYLAKENGRILMVAFKGTGAFYLPLWDLNLAHPSPNLMHMPNEIIVQELKMCLGYVCENLTY